MFRYHWYQSLWRVARVRKLFILWNVFDDFGERHNSLCLYWFCICLWKCIWPLLADVECWCLVYFTMFFYDVGVLEGPTGSIFWILYWFYTCFVQIDVRVCGGVQVFAFCLFYVVFFNDFGEGHNSLILFWFCKCFVEMHLTVVGGCQCFVFGVFYNGFVMTSWSSKN